MKNKIIEDIEDNELHDRMRGTRSSLKFIMSDPGSEHEHIEEHYVKCTSDNCTGCCTCYTKNK